MVGVLPNTLEVEGVEYDINSDFRLCLLAIVAMDDIGFSDSSGIDFALDVIFGKENMSKIKNKTEAGVKMMWFLSSGKELESKDEADPFSPPLVDWEQDERLIFTGIAGKIGRDIRMDEYCHFWTFMAYFHSMSDCAFTDVKSIRYKMAKKIKLEKSEQDFYRRNREIVDIKRDTQEREDLFNQVFGVQV